MIQYEYEPEKKGSNKFKIVDVGGQRAERTKWINCFDKLSSLLHTAPINFCVFFSPDVMLCFVWGFVLFCFVSFCVFCQCAMNVQ